MVVFNYSGKEVSAKIVYYGPGLSGKTTNLEWIYGKVPETQRGKMVSMKTKTDRTLFFDFLPLSAGEINGFKTRFLLYTVPGQVYYNATRKLVLKGADGIVFVADSDPELREANRESFENLQKNLAEYGTNLDSVPLVLQYNKRDVPNAMTVEQLDAELNGKGWPIVMATAVRGEGVFETFKEITRLVFQRMNERLDRKSATRPAASLFAAASPAAPQPISIATVASAMAAATSSAPPSTFAPPAPRPPAPPRAPQSAPAPSFTSPAFGATPAGLAPAASAAAPSAPAAPSTASAPPAQAPAADPVIHLSSIEQVLGTSTPSPGASRPQNLWSTGNRAATLAPAPAPADARPSREREPAREREDEPIVEHQVRVPITMSNVRPGRIRLVIDIDLREERTDSQGGAAK